MEILKHRIYGAAFYVILWLLLGPKVALTTLFVHVFVIPILFLFSKKFRAALIFSPFSLPFLKHDHPHKFGLEGARNFYIGFDSKVDKCTVNIGVWHALPKSLVEKHRYLIDNGSNEELKKIFEEELKNNEYPVVLYLHGAWGSRSLQLRVDIYNLLQNLNIHLVTFDYRGFGDSTNLTPVKLGVVEDSLVVYSWVRSLVGADAPVFVWGHSVGSAIAQRAFSKLELYSNSLLGLQAALPRPQGIVLEGAYTSNIELTDGLITSKVLANWIPHLIKAIKRGLNNSVDRVEPLKYADQLSWCPILMLHSRDDIVVPYRFGKKLYEKHREVRKEGDSPVNLITFENDGHCFIYKNPSVPRIIEDFIEKHKIVRGNSSTYRP